MNLFFTLLITSVNLSANIVLSAISADHRVAPSMSSSQRREIALKQVSYPIFTFIVIST